MSFRSRRWLGRAALVVCALAGACTYAPPAALELDPERAGLHGKLAQPLPSMAVAPVALTYKDARDSYFSLEEEQAALERSPEKTSETAPLTSQVASSEYTWSGAPLDAARLQQRLATVFAWGLYHEQDLSADSVNGLVPLVDPAEIAPTDPGQPVAISDAAALDDLRRHRRTSACVAADKKRAQLVALVELLECRVTFARRDGFWWWTNLALFWVGGALPVVLIPDEYYEVSTTVRVTVVHARTGTTLLQRRFTTTSEHELNDPQRGWSITGILGLWPIFANPETEFGEAWDALRPHALKDLELSVLENLRQGLPENLNEQKNKDLVDNGTEETSRTYAIVLGHKGPPEAQGIPNLRFAVPDAQAVASIFEHRLERADHVRAHWDDPTLKTLWTDVDALAKDLLGRDRLVIYYSGYGRTVKGKDGSDVPALVLGGGEDTIDVETLATELRKRLRDEGKKPSVMFILDTSFAGAGKPLPGARTYRAAADPPLVVDKLKYLEALGNKAFGWCVLAAAGAEETGYEFLDATTASSQHGFFTNRLLSALSAEGPVGVNSLERFLVERVPEDVRGALQVEQTPERRGVAEDLLVFGHRKPAPTAIAPAPSTAPAPLLASDAAFKLEGVIFHRIGPRAIVNGIAYREGESFEVEGARVTVVAISPLIVTFEQGGRFYVRKLRPRTPEEDR